ncbi:carboxypeptidase regulatory-like domain-containing protein [Demequina phytophila]|uniref:carboxypeptidase regulatory-like domain-containing protein n=1 Tax=Demequina phytophila TaxID=1638981 RepID=UPI0007851FDA|nr:carboxypeptidase regulatory-like domain-containing protein [Demequina phytophila]
MLSRMMLARAVSAACAALMITGIAVTPANAEDADPTGSVVASLTSWADGSVATGGCVEAFDSAGTSVGADCVGAAGRYTVGGLIDGDYRLKFTGFGTAPTQYYDSASTLAAASPVAVVGGGVTSLEYALLAKRSVSGTVRDSDGAPIAGAKVSLRSGTFLTAALSVLTGPDGRYVLQRPASGSYLLTFAKAGFGSISWPDKPVTLGQRLGTTTASVMRADATLTAAGTIAGTIEPPPGTVADGANACVLLYDYAGQQSVVAARCGTAGSTFRFANLRAGGYLLCVKPAPASRPCEASQEGWYGGSFSMGTNEPERVDVASGATTRVTFAWGGTVEMAVTLDNGAPLDGGCLASSTLAKRGATTDCAAADGVFTFRVDRDIDARGAAFSLTGARNAGDMSIERRVRVAAGATVAYTMVAPARGASSVTVSVTRADDRPITQGCVYAVLHGPAVVDKASDCSLGADGAASFRGLPAGRYTFEARGVSGSYDVVAYPAAVNGAEGTSVVLSGSDHHELAMVVPTTQALTGTVTDAGGTPVEGATVVRANSSGILSSTTTGADGTYRFVAPVAAAKVGVLGAAGYGAQWITSPGLAPEARSLYSRGTVVLGPGNGEVIDGADIVVAPAYGITGTIAVPDTLPVDEACVMALDQTAPIELARDCGGVGDAFDLSGLAAGSYRLCVAAEPAPGGCFDPDSPGVIFGGPAPVSVQVIDAVVVAPLAFGGTIAVTAFTRSTLDRIQVTEGCIDLTASDEVLATTCTSVDGVFWFRFGHDLPRGLWLTLRDAPGVLDGTTATQDVLAGSANVGVFLVDPWPTITGTITRPAGRDDLTVCAMAVEGGTTAAHQCVEPGRSSYELSVDPGHYRVQFYSEGPGAAYQWYAGRGKTTGLRSKAVTIQATRGTFELDATLKPEATIRGRVTASSGDPAAGARVIAYDADGRAAQATDAGDDGSYTIDSLPAGTYTMLVTGVTAQASEWFAGSPTRERATPITVATGGTARADVRMRAAGALRVTVEGGGGPGEGGCVEIYTTRVERVAASCATTDGAYSFDDLAPGRYLILATGFDGLGDGWAPGEAGVSSATPIVVVAGATAAPRIVLTPESTIAGRVTGAGSYQLEGAVASLYTRAGDLVAETAVGSTGRYAFSHVASGAYRVRIALGAALGGWVRPSDAVTPRVITVPTATGSRAVTDANRAFTSSQVKYGSAFRGTLNVPKSFRGSTVCAVALRSASTVESAFCGPHGSPFDLETTHAFVDVRMVLTDGYVTTSAAWQAFKGRTAWVGGATSYATSPVFEASSRKAFYVPVYFFTDVTFHDPAWSAISWVADAGIATPFGDGSFRPSATVNRGAMAQYLYRLAGSPDVVLPTASPYSDVSVTDRRYRAIVWMRQAGVVGGRRYRADDVMTRADTLTFLYRLAGSPGFAPPARSPYSDVSTIHGAYTAITWARARRILTAPAGSAFKPRAALTRATMAQCLLQWAGEYGG